MPGRYASATAVQYRFGFNNKEKDDEIKGPGNSLDYGERMYDPRLGRWFSVDKEAAKGPSFSPYNFALNSPIVYADPNGNWVELKIRKYYTDKDGNLIRKTSFIDIFRRTTRIEKQFVIHDAKIYFADPSFNDKSEDYKKNWMSGYQKNIEKGCSGYECKYDNGTNIQGTASKDPQTGETEYDHPVKKTISVSVTFAEPIQEVKKASDIKRTDNLYIIANDDQYNSLGGAGNAAAETTLGSNVILSRTHRAQVNASHESFHGLGLNHIDMPGDNKPGYYDTYKNMGTIYNNSESIPAMKRGLEKLEQKENK